VTHKEHEEIKNILHYKNERDFFRGTIYGAIVWAYAERFYALFQRDLTREEIVEMREVLLNKMREFSFLKYEGV
jgi:hypothetical protein